MCSLLVCVGGGQNLRYCEVPVCSASLGWSEFELLRDKPMILICEWTKFKALRHYCARIAAMLNILTTGWQ